MKPGHIAPAFEPMKLNSPSGAPLRRPSGAGSTPTVKKLSTEANSPEPRTENARAENARGERERIIKKRVRLRPESRDQLLERLRNPQLSLHEASILLRVSRATVRRYADAGRLPCLRTPGGQRRFTLRDIETFYRQLKMRR